MRDGVSSKRVSSCAAALSLLLLVSSASFAQFRGRLPGMDQTKNAEPIKNAFKDALTPAARATVLVRCDGNDAALGTVVESDGWIMTKASELKGEITVRLYDAKELSAKLVGTSVENDLALLKVEAKNLPTPVWADVKKVSVGQLVATPGAAGKPLAVGVISVGRRKIPSRSSMLGVSLDDADGGAKVRQVVPDSGAAKAGVVVDDVILAINDQPVRNREDLVEIVQNYQSGQTITLKLSRQGMSMQLSATLGKRAAEVPTRTDIMNAMGGALSVRNAGFPAVYQHDTVLKPSEVGGPLVDLNGKAIGINIARAGRTESYAIPADVVQKALAQLKAGPATQAAR